MPLRNSLGNFCIFRPTQLLIWMNFPPYTIIPHCTAIRHYIVNTSQSVQCISSAYTEYEHVTVGAMYLQRLHRIWTRHSRCNVSPAPTQNINTSQSVQCISSAYTEYKHVTVGAMYLQRLHRIQTCHSRCNVSPAPTQNMSISSTYTEYKHVTVGAMYLQRLHRI